MYKIVLQIPEEEGFDPEPWQEFSDPHGPHIKVYHDQACSETGMEMTFVRCKHRSFREVVALVQGILPEGVA